MRLDKHIGQLSDYSRKQIKQLVRSGEVMVDGIPATDAAQHIQPNQQVVVNGQALGTVAPRYFMLHKPKGYICATKDGDHPVVLDLLDEPNKDKLQIAGRLDIDTTGLVLITDDGQWNHAVTSPRRSCLKRYHVCTAEAISDKTESLFQRGLMLDGEKQRTKPAQLTILFANEALLSISEGKYHQVKRMFAAVGNRVEELHREAIGDIELDKDLAQGDYRDLTEAEIASVVGSRKF